MSTPTEVNRLATEESPYLRQHADNPVNWQPWDEQARAAAREADVPIFLSIGYAACHWCHVMEEESFQDEAIATVLNENFVPIKVDREERPDVDSIYMSICQRVTGRGGWPLSAWLTPEGDPFYVGTYFPPEAKRGQPGFRQLLEEFADSWDDPEERAEIEDRAAEWSRAIEDELESVPEPAVGPESGADDGPAAAAAGGEGDGEGIGSVDLPSDLLERAAETAVRGADRQKGGWGRGPKFPHPGRIHLLLAANARTDRDQFRAVATETLDAMGSGGLYDQLGGGFHRYATDRDWTVPHFEKMLYDNAELPRAYLAGWQVTGRDRYRTIVEETLEFLERELQAPHEALYSTLDARSPPVDPGNDTSAEAAGDDREMTEGAFYVWTPPQVREAVATYGVDSLDVDLIADLLCDRFGITQAGNFEGATVLTRAARLDHLAGEYDLPVERVADLLERGRDCLWADREARPRPPRDEKVLASWNGLAISTLAEAALVLKDDEALASARNALSTIQDEHWDAESETLFRRSRGGAIAIPGYLEDYAFLARGALDCYQAGGTVEPLAFALELARTIETEFWDPDAGTVYFTPESGEDLVARPQELTDQSTPASAGVAVEVLASLSHFVPHDRFRDIAETVLRTHTQTIESDPLRHVSLARAADRIQRGRLELTLVADEPPTAWRDQLADRYLPDRLIAWRPASEPGLAEWLDALGLSSAPPIWANRTPLEGEPAVYVCRARTCSPPNTDLGEALAWAEKQRV